MGHTLSEYDSKKLLAEFGIEVPDERLTQSAEQAAAAARELGLPVAAKLCGAKVSHKTERNLVRLGLENESAVATASAELLAAATSDDGDVGVLIAPMVSGRRELIAGLIRDPQFGGCVMLGLGGIFAEALEDVAFAVAPLDDIDAHDLIGALQNQKLLAELRGERETNRKALAKLLCCLGAIAEARPNVASIDLNPLIIRDGEPVVVDALVELVGDPQ